MLKLNELEPALRRRIEKQVAEEDAAKNIRQPMAELVRPKPQHREVQTLESRPPKQAKRDQALRQCSIIVVIVRYGRKELDDDNLVASHKALRDCVATYFGIDDGDPRIKFNYDQVQTKGATGTHVLVSM